MPINTFKEDEQVTEVVKIHTLKRLFKYMLVYKKQILIVLGFMSVILGVRIINPLLIQIATDKYIENNNFQGLVIIGIVTLVINTISMYCLKKRVIIMSEIANDVLVTIRQELYTHIQKLSFNFFDNRPVGKILARVIGDVNSLKDVLFNSVVTLIPDFIQICAVAIIMMILNFRLAIGALMMLPFMITIMYVIQLISHKRWQKFRKKNSNVNAFTHEAFSGIRVVQNFTAEEQTNKIFDGLVLEVKKAFLKAIQLNDLFWPIVELSWGIGTALVFWNGVKLINTGSITIGQIQAFMVYITMFWNPIINLSNFYNQLITNMAGAERIFEIMDIEPDIIDSQKAINLPTINGEVIFDRVSFGYKEHIKILDQVSFKVKQGETIALVGPTGAGKSTIVNLISRFYEIEKGKILIDGYNITDVSIESLRSQMGIMTQDNFLFSGTIMDNIRYGRLNATVEDIIKAAKSVNAHEFIIKLENGYNTKINERGNKLSIGQRQLIAFARTLLSNPRILILDEATSSIDTHTERLLQKGIETLLKDRTSFVIAHRLSTIQKADRIFVVDQGNILEEGSHQELLNKKGTYYNLYMAQFKAIS